MPPFCDEVTAIHGKNAVKSNHETCKGDFMANGCISIDRILEKLDQYLHANDYLSAERHLKYWHDEARLARDVRAELFLLNELMGLYRKTNRQSEAVECAEQALGLAHENFARTVTAATTYINAATVYKAFSLAGGAIPLFEAAREIYERLLDKNDTRLGGLYNNMGLALVDLSRFGEAKEAYQKAIGVMSKHQDRDGEVAITYLNLATAAEREHGLVDGDEMIQGYLDIAESLLENCKERDGYYAFVCEKCASVFGYYGRFAYEKTLYKRAEAIYSENRAGGALNERA